MTLLLAVAGKLVLKALLTATDNAEKLKEFVKVLSRVTDARKPAKLGSPNIVLDLTLLADVHKVACEVVLDIAVRGVGLIVPTKRSSTVTELEPVVGELDCRILLTIALGASKVRDWVNDDLTLPKVAEAHHLVETPNLLLARMELHDTQRVSMAPLPPVLALGEGLRPPSEETMIVIDVDPVEGELYFTTSLVTTDMKT